MALKFILGVLCLSFSAVQSKNLDNCVRHSGTRSNEGPDYLKSDESRQSNNYNMRGECQNRDRNGKDYNGMMSRTKSGYTCQTWKSQSPHKHSFQHLGDHNYCRNPNNEPAVWCYTTDSNKRWDFCEVPFCDGNYNNMNQDTYRGKMSGNYLPKEVFEKMQYHAKRAGCTMDCMKCLSKIKCTENMKQVIPEKYSSHEEDDRSSQKGVEVFFSIPNIPGFKEMEPMKQMMAQDEQCDKCTPECIKGSSNLDFSDLLKKWFPQVCSHFADKSHSQIDTME